MTSIRPKLRHSPSGDRLNRVLYLFCCTANKIIDPHESIVVPDTSYHATPEIPLLVGVNKSDKFSRPVAGDHTPKLLIQQLDTRRLVHEESSSLEGQLMSLYNNPVAAKLLLTNARVNNMILNIASTSDAESAPRQDRKLCSLGEELEIIGV